MIILSPTRVADMLFMTAFALAAMRQPALLRKRYPLAGVFGFYVVVRVAGIFVAPEKSGALVQLFSEAGLITVVLSYFAFCVVRDGRVFDRLVTTLLAGGVVTSLAGLWEWVTRQDFSATVLMPLIGVTLEARETLELKVGQIPRIRSTLDHPLALGGWMAFLFPFALQRAIVRSGAARLGYALITLAFGVSLFLSFSRIAQLAVILETAVVLYLYARRGLTWLLAAVVGGGAIALISIYRQTSEGYVGSSLLVPHVTVRMLGERWVELGKAFSWHPVAAFLGFGFSRFAPNDYPIESMMPSDLSAYYSRIDTDILKIVAVTGILGFISWLAIFLKFFRRVWHARLRAYASEQAAILATAIAVAGCLLTAVPGASVLTYTQTWPMIAICMSAALGSLVSMQQQPTMQTR